jgi:2'-5' RNA ligase
VGKRLFLAIDVDDRTRDTVDRLSQTLRHDPEVRNFGRTSWVQKDRMHLTLHFVADADISIERSLMDALAKPFAQRPFELTFEGLGFFPERGTPRVLWLGIGEGLAELRAIHAEVRRRVGPGEHESEKFHPHLTLARFRDRVPRTGLTKIAAVTAVAGPSLIDRVTLYESRLSPKGPTYTALSEAPLKAMP